MYELPDSCNSARFLEAQSEESEQGWFAALVNQVFPKPGKSAKVSPVDVANLHGPQIMEVDTV